MPIDRTQPYAAFAARIDAFGAENGLPGAVLALVENGEIVWTHACGEAQLGTGRAPGIDSVFRIASMTKSFTAAAIMLLRERGALALDDPIVRHLPWTETIGAPRGARPITIRDLLTMNGGFPTDDPWGDRHENTPVAAFDALVAGGCSFTRLPGSGFEYSNLGYALLGRIVTQTSGVDYLEFVVRELLEPLGMRATRFDAHAVDEAVRAHGYAIVDGKAEPEPMVGTGAFSPMGGLHASARDVATWVRGFANPEFEAHPLSSASRRDMQQGRTFAGFERRRNAQAEGEEPAIVSTLYGFGLAVDIDSRLGTFVHHSGGYPGFGSHMRWHAASGFGIVALANRTYAPVRQLAAELLNRVVAEFAPRPDVAASLWPETREAMDVAEKLLARWDDALADARFAHNVDLDLPRAHRRLAFARIGQSIGPFARISDSLTSRSPAHAAWRVEGARGRAKLEVLMSPDRPPRIQLFDATSIPPE